MNPAPQRLSQVALFAGLSEEERERLASWLEVEEFEPGKHLAREGVSDYEFFILDDGKVRVEHEGRTVRMLGPGEAFGELAFAADGRRTADVIADTPVRVFMMFGTRFREMQIEMPDVARRLQDLARSHTESAQD